MRRTAMAVVAALMLSAPAFAEPVTRFYLGANGMWYSGSLNLPDDFELGGTARASFSPHIAAVGGAFYGVEESYLRAYLGPRVTITDTENRDFSIGVGASYNVSSEPVVRPEEWTADVAIGWRPSPIQMPRVVFGLGGSYGLASEQASLILAVRYALQGYPGETEVTHP